MRHILITLLIITGVVICSWEAGVVPGEALRSRDQQPWSAHHPRGTLELVALSAA